jgi:hypothetical protein
MNDFDININTAYEKGRRDGYAACQRDAVDDAICEIKEKVHEYIRFEKMTPYQILDEVATAIRALVPKEEK